MDLKQNRTELPQPGCTGTFLGACPTPDGCSFRLWAPNASEIALHLVSPVERRIPMQRDEAGYFQVDLTPSNLPLGGGPGPKSRIGAGARYFFTVNGISDFPDPASRFQPEGVHAASEVIDPAFDWSDSEWFGLPLREYIIYELHIGTFTPEGTFDAAAQQLARLKDLGITAVEVMPVAQFPGERNWGYDGVGLFAVQSSYGGPLAFKRFIDAAHQHGLAVILDVVYNHLGPEGNYLSHFAPYFTDKYRTPWGAAVNFDGAHSDGVREFFIENALYWQTHFHIDALRLDAVHAIRDFSAVPFLRQLSRATRERAEKLNRRFYLIGESDLNAPRFILPEQQGGCGLDAQWSDDFHHCLHVLLTGERRGYYEDYSGGVEQFAKVWRQGYAYTGEYSRFRKAFHGDQPELTTLKQFVICAQNHDQVGNRMLGDRLSTIVDFDSLKLAAGTVLLSPFVPLLFMGEEYGERAPFQYFVDHGHEELLEAVRKGRRDEFAAFLWSGEVPDPASDHTFLRSQIDPSAAETGAQEKLLGWYRELIHLRKRYPCFRFAERSDMEVRSFPAARTLAIHYCRAVSPELLLLLCFADEPAEINVDWLSGAWTGLLDSTDPQWGGGESLFPEPLYPGALGLPRRSLALFARQPLSAR